MFDEVAQGGAEVPHLGVAEALAELIFDGVTFGECAGTDALAGGTEEQASAAAVSRVLVAFEVAQGDHVVGEPAGALLAHAEQFCQARHGGLLGGDGPQHEPEGGSHGLTARGGDRLTETIGHAAVGGGDEDREVRLGHWPHGGTKVAPSAAIVASAPTGTQASARNDCCSGTRRVKSVPAGRMRQSPASTDRSTPSTSATA